MKSFLCCSETRAACTAGSKRAIKMLMMAMTTSSSMSVKPSLTVGGAALDIVYSTAEIRAVPKVLAL
jgi:hypothetical protein